VSRTSVKTAFHLGLVGLVLASLFWYTREESWNAMRLCGAAILILSFPLWALARIQLGESFAVRAQARTLVTHGLYARIRNPIYLFGSFMIVGMFLLLGMPLLLLVFLVIIPLQLFRIRREEKVLEGKFGESYRRYKRQTWF
jgi:protein-S-isoprenylcysteine O-methyltransferase Ste14